jgi:hypothetical protein
MAEWTGNAVLLLARVGLTRPSRPMQRFNSDNVLCAPWACGLLGPIYTDDVSAAWLFEIFIIS